MRGSIHTVSISRNDISLRYREYEIVMQICLNKNLKETPINELVWATTADGKYTELPLTIERRIDELHKAILQHTDKKRIVVPIDGNGAESAQQGYLWLVARAYSYHQRLVITPTNLWYIIVSEISEQVANSPDTFQSIFARSNEPVEISVRTDDITTLPYDKVIESLQQHVPVDVSVFIPEFTTNSPAATLAMNAAFCGIVKHYYKYSTFMCGFPAIDLQGTDNDWQLFDTHLDQLIHMLPSELLRGWLGKIRGIVEKIRNSLVWPDISFLSEFFSSSRIGSGGELKIDGWLSEFWVFRPSLPKLENFSNHWGTIPYTNIETGRKFIGVHGCFLQRRNDAGYVYSDYASMVVE